MSDRPIHVLVLCTGNSARSILAEALLNHLGKGAWKAFSAGSHPVGAVNPLALEVLAENGISTEGLRSKSWDEFASAGPETPEIPETPEVMDLVITVCDNAAGEVCPVWPGHPARLHLGFADPAAVDGDPEQRRQAFRLAFGQIGVRMAALVELGLQRAGELCDA